MPPGKTDVMHQSVYELVHTEDQQELRRNLHWALNPPPATIATMTQDSPPGELRPLLITVWNDNNRCAQKCDLP